MSTTTRTHPIDVVLAPLRWLERSRGWRRRLLILLYLIVGTILGLLSWRATSLRNLPDVGDPFDVAAFVESTKVPEADDATVLYRRAADQYVPSVVTQNPQGLINALQVGWAMCSPEHRKWVEDNRPGLEIWRKATERPAASPISLAEMSRSMGLIGAIVSMTQAAILEGSRLQDLGDAKSAWLWYRGVLRASHHLRRHSGLSIRKAANDLQDQVKPGVHLWIASAETDAAMLKEAIEELERLDSQVPSASETFKAEYLEIMRTLDNPSPLLRRLDSEYNHESTRPYLRVFLFMKREPERSRRVARLMFANWLVYCDRPIAMRPPMVTDPRFPGVWFLFQTDAQTPEPAKVMAPRDVLEWFKTSWYLFDNLLPMAYYFPAPDQERRVYADLMVFAAERLYLMENGTKSPGVEALVPRYLKAIPVSYAPAPPG